MGKTASDIINKALSFVGMMEDPKGSNIIQFTLDYFDGKLPANPAASCPWCVIFGWDVFRMCGASDLFFDGKKVGSCTQVLRWATANNLTVDKSKAKYGDILLFDWNKDAAPDHFGFALAAPNNGKIQTVEGNTDDGVFQKTRSMSDVGYVIRPRYAGSKYPSLETLQCMYDYLRETYDILKGE